MTTVSVTWYGGVWADVRAIFAAAPNAAVVRSAVQEANELLRVRPEAKGKAVVPSELDEPCVRELSMRVASLPATMRPTQFRRLCIGPVEVFFEPVPLDAMVKIWFIRTRLTPR
jgi:hypothetical protein